MSANEPADLEVEENITLEALKKLYKQANLEIVEKDALIQKLSSELDKLKLDKKNKNLRKKKKLPVCASVEVEVVKKADDKKVEGGGGVHPVGVFPVEIWEKILNNVTEPKDLRNLSLTHILFDKLVSPSKTTWMFAKVIPHLYFYLKKKSIMNCRLVSKTWNVGLDTFLENPKCIRPHDDSSNDPDLRSSKPPFVNPMRMKRLGGYYVIANNQLHHSLTLLTLFEDYMKDHPRNPFVGRTVTIAEYLDGEVSVAQFWSLVYRFMKKFGEHIWYLTINLFNPERTASASQKLLRFVTVDVHRFCPGLRRLRICGHVGKFSAKDERELEVTPWPFPRRLETLQLDDVLCKEPNLLVDTLINRSNILLKRLHVKAATWKNVYKYTSRNGVKWEELKELHVEELSTMDHFDALLKMDVPNLRKLGLSLAKTEVWTFDKIMEVLHEVSKYSSLHTLRLSGNIPLESFEKVDSNSFAPSTLKTLEVEHCGVDGAPLTCYTFLARFPHLENFHLFYRKERDWSLRTEAEMKCRSEIDLRSHGIDYDYRPYKRFLAEDKKEVVEVNKIIYGNDSDFYTSNIWEVLPQLMMFTLQHMSFTRIGYEHANKNKAVHQLHGETSGQSTSTPPVKNPFDVVSPNGQGNLAGQPRQVRKKGKGSVTKNANNGHQQESNGHPQQSPKESSTEPPSPEETLPNVAVGDIVCIVEEHLPTTEWKVGRILHLLPIPNTNVVGYAMVRTIRTLHPKRYVDLLTPVSDLALMTRNKESE